MSVNIQQSVNFSQFKFFHENREICRFHVEEIKKSIKEKNNLKTNPIIVDKDFYVIDGQHRLKAATELKTPIYYIIDEKGSLEDILINNINRRNWSIEDYIAFYAKKEKGEYVFLEKLLKKAHGFGGNLTALGSAISVLCKKTSKNNFSSLVKRGEVTINDKESLENFVNITFPRCNLFNRSLKENAIRVSVKLFFKAPYIASLASCNKYMKKEEYEELLDCIERDCLKFRDINSYRDVLESMALAYNKAKKGNRFDFQKNIYEKNDRFKRRLDF